MNNKNRPELLIQLNHKNLPAKANKRTIPLLVGSGSSTSCFVYSKSKVLSWKRKKEEPSRLKLISFHFMVSKLLYLEAQMSRRQIKSLECAHPH